MALLQSVLTMFLNGLSLGLIFALAASGFSLIFGVLDVLNFAHGSFFMVGAYLGLSIYKYTGSFLGTIPLVAIATFGIGVLTERLTFHNLYDKGPAAQVLTSFALIFIIEDLVSLVWGKGFKTFTVPSFLGGTLSIGSFSYSFYRLFFMLIAVVVLIIVYVLMDRTNLNIIARAGSQDKVMLGVLGININKFYTLLFGIGIALAGIGGFMYGPMTVVSLGLGHQILFTVIIVAFIGGLGNFKGAIGGGIILGFANVVLKNFLPAFTWTILYGLLVVVLIYKPSGFFGKEALSMESRQAFFSFERIELDKEVKQWLGRGAFLSLFLVVPFVASYILGTSFLRLATYSIIFGIITMSFDIAMGYGKLISLGHTALVGVGGYTIAMVGIHLTNSFFVILILVILVSAALAAVMGYVCLQAGAGLGFATATIGVSLVVSNTFQRLDITGGTEGLSVPDVNLFGPLLNIDLTNLLPLYLLTVAALACLYYASRYILESPLGYVYRASGGHEKKVQSLGFNVINSKLSVYIFSGICAGIGGMLLSMYSGWISPSQFGLFILLNFTIMSVLGGLGTLVGPVLGAFIFVFMKDITSSLFFGHSQLILGILLILIIMFFPEGFYNYMIKIIKGLQKFFKE